MYRKKILVSKYIFFIAASVLLALSTCLISRGTNVENQYITTLLIPVILLSGLYGVFSLKYFKEKEIIFLILAVFWFFAGFFIRKDPVIELEDLKAVVYMAGLAAVAFPMASFLDDEKNKRALDAFLIIIMLVFAVGCWISFVGAIKHHDIVFLSQGFGPNYSETGRIQLRIFSMHQYYSGMLCGAFIYAIVYLLVKYRSRKIIIPAVILAVTFAAVVVLSGGRTVIFGWFIGIVYLVALLLYRSKIKRCKKVAIVFGTAVGCTGVALAGMNFIYKNVTHSIRNVWYGLLTLTSRTEIWSSVYFFWKEHPLNIFLGIRYSGLMDALNPYIPIEDEIGHLHSSFFQSLAVLGIPGFVLVMAVVVFLLINSYRIFIADEETEVTLADKMLVVIPLVLLVQAMFEPILFMHFKKDFIVNVVFNILAGYVIFQGKILKK